MQPRVGVEDRPAVAVQQGVVSDFGVATSAVPPSACGTCHGNPILIVRRVDARGDPICFRLFMQAMRCALVWTWPGRGGAFRRRRLSAPPQPAWLRIQRDHYLNGFQQQIHPVPPESCQAFACCRLSSSRFREARRQRLRFHGRLNDRRDGLANLFAGEEEMVALEVEPLGQALEFVGTGQAGFVAPVCCNNFRSQFRVAGCNDIIIQLE